MKPLQARRAGDQVLTVLGAGTADIWGHTWGYWWAWESLSSGSFPFAHAPLRHPDGQAWWVRVP